MKLLNTEPLNHGIRKRYEPERPIADYYAKISESDGIERVQVVHKGEGMLPYDTDNGEISYIKIFMHSKSSVILDYELSLISIYAKDETSIDEIASRLL